MAAPHNKKADGHIEAVPESRLSDDIQTEKGQLDQERARELAVTFDPNSPENKALVRKIDWRLVPCTWTLYLLSNVDRSNIGWVVSAQSPAVADQSLGMPKSVGWKMTSILLPPSTRSLFSSSSRATWFAR